MAKSYITDPVDKKKVTCHRCGGFIVAGTGMKYDRSDFLEKVVWFHVDCFNPDEHYYGLDKPKD